MQNDSPNITVLMPVYNAQAYLKMAIDSILNQTLTNFELLIINDGSTDESEEIILSYEDKRIRYIKNDRNIKLIATLNKGIKLSLGKYIARMDADDISHPDRLRKQFELLEKNPKIGVCGTWFETIEKSVKISKYPKDDISIRIKMLYQCPFCHPSVMYRKDILVKNDLSYNTNYIHAEDYELWVQLAKYTKFANIPEVLLQYRIHATNVSIKHQDEQIDNSKKIVKLLFNRLGINLTDDQYKLYLKIAYADFSFNEKEILEAEKLLSNIYSMNKVAEWISEPKFKEYIFSKWFDICTNSTHLGIKIFKLYYYSVLSSPSIISKTQLFKFLIKSLIRKKS